MELDPQPFETLIVWGGLFAVASVVDFLCRVL